MPHLHFYPDNLSAVSVLHRPRLLYTGTVGDDPDWYNLAHSHDYCELLYVIEGRGWAQIGEHRCELAQGNLVVLDPSVLHEEHSDKQSPLRFAFCAIDSFAIEGLPPCGLLSAGRYPVIETGDCRYRMESVFADLIHETSEQVSFCNDMSNSLVSMLLVLAIRLLLAQPTSRPTAMSEECSRVAEFINSNYSEPLSLADLSQTVYVSKHHLAHIFKSQTGVSPIRYLINKRISEAKRLLRETELTVGEISVQVGYNDPVYFSQIFKKSTGMSPSVYRKKDLLI